MCLGINKNLIYRDGHIPDDMHDCKMENMTEDHEDHPGIIIID